MSPLYGRDRKLTEKHFSFYRDPRAMGDISGKIIRLAHANPGFRRDLEPLLRKIAEVRREALRKKQMEKLLDKGGDFGVISAYTEGSKKQNKVRHGELMRDLQKKGYKPETLKGSWEGVTEKSMLVPDIRPEDLFELGRKYKQDAVIHKSENGVLGMYYTKGEPRAQLAVDPKGEVAADVSLDKDLYSKGRGLSFEFGFLWDETLPWDGEKPLGADKVKELVQKKYAPEEGEKTTKDAPKKTRKDFEKAVEGRRFKHPDTGNDVLLPSLPDAEQARLFQQWSAG
jgi:hypothetical protein